MTLAHCPLVDWWVYYTIWLETWLVAEACVFNGDLFRNLTVVSSRMELNFEPNSSVLSCARVRGEKNRQKNAEKR